MKTHQLLNTLALQYHTEWQGIKEKKISQDSKSRRKAARRVIDSYRIHGETDETRTASSIPQTG